MEEVIDLFSNLSTNEQLDVVKKLEIKLQETVEGPQIYHFTFKTGSIYKNHSQPVIASTFEDAIKLMEEVHGSDVGFCYSQEQWEQLRIDGLGTGHELELIDIRRCK